jgi:hypothetical protein
VFRINVQKYGVSKYRCPDCGNVVPFLYSEQGPVVQGARSEVQEDPLRLSLFRERAKSKEREDPLRLSLFRERAWGKGQGARGKGTIKKGGNIW